MSAQASDAKEVQLSQIPINFNTKKSRDFRHSEATNIGSTDCLKQLFLFGTKPKQDRYLFTKKMLFAKLRNHDDTEPVVVVAVAGSIVVAIRHTAVSGIVVPTATAQNTVGAIPLRHLTYCYILDVQISYYVSFFLSMLALQMPKVL